MTEFRELPVEGLPKGFAILDRIGFVEDWAHRVVPGSRPYQLSDAHRTEDYGCYLSALDARYAAAIVDTWLLNERVGTRWTPPLRSLLQQNDCGCFDHLQ